MRPGPPGTVVRGEVWWCDLEGIPRRPVVVLSRDQAIVRRRLCVVAPCTTTIRDLATEVLLEPGDDPVPKVSVVNLDSLAEVPVALLTERLGRLSTGRMAQVCEAMAMAMGCGH
ncbi:type II toxin-antitoxin system PemK/MazF family toxin [Propionibacteriaceae bacterium Y2011]|uniref:type II toxin-antitoxin system PemK/MazF family toxin n=1 Tax=Microlunatus sp. Y2014 TaxID=3418488 RepID=UPI003B4886F6